jgi:transcriptional regulator with XRE-family HTH domain
MHHGINLTDLARGLIDRRLFTTKSLGEAIGLSQPSVSRLASGKTKEIGAYPALRLIELAGGTVTPPVAVEVGLKENKRSGIPQPRLSRWEAGEAPAAADDALRLRRLCEELAAVETVGDETAAPQPTATPEPTHAAS